MGVIKEERFCHNCGEYAYRSILQQTCPYCGHYYIISDIKWLFKWAVILIMLFGFLSCAGKGSESNSNKQDTANQTYQQN